MKYAIYDKAADGYLTKMEFEVGYSENTQFECGYRGCIADAKLLCTPKEAADAIVRIESFKFMEKGRFVIHSFDDTLKCHYIISEAGEPTKVVDNITVNIDGTIDVKYGTMVSHWSTSSLEYAINRMNALQKAKDSRYTAWCNTFDIYKVINVIDEKSSTHYQFIKVTNKGLTEYANNEVDPLNKRIEELESINNKYIEDTIYFNECRRTLSDMIRAIKYAICSKDGDKRDNYISYMTDKIKNDETFNRPELKTAKNDITKIRKRLTTLSENQLNKRIEELEKANYDLGQQSLTRGLQADRLKEENDRLKEENDNLKIKVESIKKEAHNWKKLYENVDKDREVLKNVIDNIYDDLGSTDICKGLKETLDYVKGLTELNYISIHHDDTPDGTPIYISAESAFKYIIHQMMVIMESLELNQSVAFASADEVEKARHVADDIVAICEADDKFERTLEKFSQLYEAVNAVHNIDDDPIMHAFWGMLLIFSTMDRKLEDFVDEIHEWKSKAQKAEKALDDQKKLNDANKATIARLIIEKRNMDEKVSNAADWLEEVNDKNEGLSNMLKEITSSIADIMFATRTTDHDKMISDLTDVSLKIGVKTMDDGPMYGISVILTMFIRSIKEETNWKCRAEEAISDYTRCNGALGEWKRKYKTMRQERDKALELKEEYKSELNSIDTAIDYCLHDCGIISGGRCCGKQLMADILSGKKIPISKDKYDSIMTSLKFIDLSYAGVYGTMIHISPKPKPTWLPGLMKELKDLTE